MQNISDDLLPVAPCLGWCCSGSGTGAALVLPSLLLMLLEVSVALEAVGGEGKV